MGCGASSASRPSAPYEAINAPAGSAPAGRKSLGKSGKSNTLGELEKMGKLDGGPRAGVRKVVEQSCDGQSFFMNLTPAERAAMVNAMIPRECAVGEMILVEGEPGDEFFVVMSGKYEAYKEPYEAGDVLLRTFVSGMAFGELALMYNAPRAASVRCREAGELWKLPRDSFQQICSESANKRPTHLQKPRAGSGRRPPL